MEEKILHLVTQRNQPYGSTRKCCERCGLAVFVMKQGESYVEHEESFTAKIAHVYGYVRCCDVKSSVREKRAGSNG